jgi:hypothetical protein
MSLWQPVGSPTSLELCSNANPHQYRCLLLTSPPWNLNGEIHLDLFQTWWCRENLTTGLFLTTMPMAITTPSSNTWWAGTLCTATEYSLLCIGTHSCTKWDHQLLILSPQPISSKLMNFSVLLCKFLCSQRSFASTFCSNLKVMAVGSHSNCKQLVFFASPLCERKGYFFCGVQNTY